MKKLLVLSLAALAVVSLVGCGTKGEKADKEENLNSNANAVVESNEGASEKEIYFAKVKKVVGHEISVKLSDEKFENGMELGEPLGNYESDESQMAGVQSGDTVTLEDGTTMETITVDPNAAQSGGILSEMEFNGEEKDFTIQAGVEIFNMITGKEGNTSELKEESIVFIGIDSKTNELISIDILQ